MKIRFFVWYVCLTVLLHLRSPGASVLDTTFNPGSGANGIVEQVLPLPDGRILICGNFTTFNGKNHSYIARLNGDGSLDETFSGQASYWVRNMSVQSDGKIVIGGFFKGVQGTTRNLIARLNSDGSLDPSFDPGSGCTDSLGVAIDGNADPFVFWVAIQPDGKILATGNFRNYNGVSSTGIVRINPNGSRDTSFNVGGGLDSWGRHIELLPGGQILLSGWFTSYNGQGFNRLARSNADGSPDASFNPFFGDRTAIYSTARLANNKYVVAGHSLNYDGLFNREMERLNSDGSVDSGFIGFTNEKTESIALQSDGKIIIGGYFNAVNGVQRTSVARMFADGTLDSSFQAAIDNYVWSVSLDKDGKLMIAGGFYTVDGVSRNGVARLITGAAPNAQPPVAPVLAAATVNSSSQVTLTWTDAATDRSGYTVERKTGSNGTYATIATLGSSARSYVNSGLTAGTQYFFRLRGTTTADDVVYSNELAATTTAAAGGSATATFIGLDSTTRGDWKGVYGAEGYSVFGDLTAYPAYAQVTVQGKTDWIWAYSTAEARALQKVNSSTDRIAGCWFASSGFSIDLAFTDGLKHRVSLYMLDWDGGGRVQTAQVIDGDTGAVLNSQNISGFSGGAYLTWEFGGHVKINVTPTSGNAVASGIFFGGAGTQQEVAATPVISPRGGRYVHAPPITIATATDGAEIRYTMNGTEPTSSSFRYVGPFRARFSATIKAKAFKAGALPSATASTLYRLGTVSN